MNQEQQSVNHHHSDIDQSDTRRTESLPGAVLRQARNRAGLSQLDISELLHLRISVIEELETSQFDPKREDTFTRGYLKNYAKRVGIDPEEIAAMFDQIKGKQTVSPSTRTQDIKSFSNKASRQKSDSRLVKLTLLVLLIFVGLTVAWWWQNQDKIAAKSTVQKNQQLDQAYSNSITDTSAASVATTNNGQTTEIVKDNTEHTSSTNDISSAQTIPATIDHNQSSDTAIIPTTSGDHSAATTHVDVNTNNADNNVTNQNATTSTDATAPIITTETTATIAPDITTNADLTAPKPALKKGAQAFELIFSDNCWLSVTDSTKKVIYAGTKRKGQTLSLSTDKFPITVSAGVPSAITAKVNGTHVDFSRTLKGKKFTLPQ